MGAVILWNDANIDALELDTALHFYSLAFPYSQGIDILNMVVPTKCERQISGPLRTATG